jgi:hypothetical protein
MLRDRAGLLIIRRNFEDFCTYCPRLFGAFCNRLARDILIV